MSEVVGYFGWFRSITGPIPQKYDFDRVGMSMSPIRQGEAEYKELLIQENKLTAEKWKLNLDQLAERYPCPQEFVPVRKPLITLP